MIHTEQSGKPSVRTRTVAIEHVKEKAAREIVAAIQKWRGDRIESAKRRWVFELIQNAIDTAKSRGHSKLVLKFDYDGKVMRFSHNGGYFVDKEFNALIYGGSSKPYESESDLLGRFGTGFLVSHIISRKVSVSGYLSEGNEGVSLPFEIEIDRESDDAAKIAQLIDKCHERLDAREPISTPSECWTKYTYLTEDSLERDAVIRGLEQLKQNIIPVMRFNDIETIIINGEELGRPSVIPEGRLEKVSFGSDFAYTITSKKFPTLQVAILVGKSGIVGLSGRPTIFLGQPVTDSWEYLLVPFILNDPKLEPTPDRDSLRNTDGNRERLLESLKLYLEMLSETAGKKGALPEGCFRLVQFKMVPAARAQNPLFQSLNTSLKQTFQKILDEIKLVKNEPDRLTVAKTVFPSDDVAGKKLNQEKFDEFVRLARIVGKQMPIGEELSDWLFTAAALKPEFPASIATYSLVSLRDELDKFVNEEESLPKFERLGEKFGMDEPKQFFLDLYKLVDSLYAEHSIAQDFMQKLLPSQSGTIGPKDQLWDGKKFQLQTEDAEHSIPAELKDLITAVGREVRDELIDNEYAEFQIVKDWVHELASVDKAVSSAISDDRCELPSKITDTEGDKAKAWIELFRWCASNNALQKGFPIITKGLDVLEVEDLQSELMLVPFDVQEIEKEFEEIYPKKRILNDSYFAISDDRKTKMKAGLGEYGAFITALPSQTGEMTFSHEKVRSVDYDEKEVAKVRHLLRTLAPEKIDYLPFWPEVIGGVSELEDQARLLFRFAFGYLAKKSSNWKGKAQVECNCGDKAHVIRPSNWLAGMKTDAWVPVRITDADGNEKFDPRAPSRESIEMLFGKEKFTELISSNAELALDLVPHFGFDRLDLKVKILSQINNKKEVVFRNDVSDLVELVGVVTKEDVAEMVQDPVMFQQALQQVRKSKTEQQLKEENKVVGENIQEVMLKILEDLGINVSPTYVGGDIEVWPTYGGMNEGSDEGEIAIGTTTIEVKSTRGNRVHLSRAQSENAGLKKELFVLLVVENTGGLRDRLKVPLDPASISDDLKEELVSRSRVVEGVYDKLGNLPNADEVEADISGYWIKKKVWDGKTDLRSWAKSKFSVAAPPEIS